MHDDHPQHSMEIQNTEIPTIKSRWFERGVKQALNIRALNTSLNREGGTYNLPPVWDYIIKQRVKADRLRMGEGELVIIFSHNAPNNIRGRTELKKLIGVSENFCEFNFTSTCVLSVKRTRLYDYKTRVDEFT